MLSTNSVPDWPTPAEASECIDERVGFEVVGEFDCWIWHSVADTGGYGPILAFFEAAFGELPYGMRLYHRCPNGRRGCVRPRHLDALPDDVAIPEPPLSVLEQQQFQVKLADERLARKWNRAQMARYLGVGAETLRTWEAGEHRPSPDLSRMLARKFGWDDAPRKWAVTLVVQRIVSATSAGAAVRAAIEPLEDERDGLKFEVAEVQKLQSLRRPR